MVIINSQMVMVTKIKRESAFANATNSFVGFFPALVVSFAALRVTELIAINSINKEVITGALIFDVLSLLRFLPGLYIISLPALLIPWNRIRLTTLLILWSIVLIVQALLVQYFIASGVLLGADILGYSISEIHQTLGHGLQLNKTVTYGFIVSLMILWILLFMLRTRVNNRSSIKLPLLVFIGATAFLSLGSAKSDIRQSNNHSIHNITLNKSAYFYDENLAYLFKKIEIKKKAENFSKDVTSQGTIEINEENKNHETPIDPKYPFLRLEKTPDTLGAFFKIDPNKPPNLVFIVVEGLGRDFSGPDARLGSFTPFLDSLISKSLYWDNFLATQGRTFGVMPSIFSSAPFGQHGFADEDRTSASHQSLLSILKNQGYRTKFYSGTDPDFDNVNKYLSDQHIDKIFSKKDFDTKYKTTNDWGFADEDLIRQVSEEESAENNSPFISVIQTITMHSPFNLRDDRLYDRILTAHLNAIKKENSDSTTYNKDKKIYKTILYTDNALKIYIEEAAKLPSFSNTIFIITGDHRLPEIEMDTVIDRYHVPLIIYSELLKEPKRIKSVSSHFDIAPSLLAFLANNYGIKTPKLVAWIGTGLDAEPSFRNLHSYPLKQTKVNLVDYVSNEWLLNQGALYRLNDGFNIESVNNPAILTELKDKLDRFIVDNDSFSLSGRLIPEGLPVEMIGYNESDRTRLLQKQKEVSAEVKVEKVSLSPNSGNGKVNITVVLSNSGASKSDVLVPLAVITDVTGNEIKEFYGAAISISPNKEETISISGDISGLNAKNFFISIIPSHPDSGKPVGLGRYHIPISIN